MASQPIFKQNNHKETFNYSLTVVYDDGKGDYKPLAKGYYVYIRREEIERGNGYNVYVYNAEMPSFLRQLTPVIRRNTKKEKEFINALKEKDFKEDLFNLEFRKVASEIALTGDKYI